MIRNKLKRWSRVSFRNIFKLKSPREIPVDLNLVFLQRDDGFYRNLKYREFEFIMQKGFSRVEKISSEAVKKDSVKEKVQ